MYLNEYNGINIFIWLSYALLIEVIGNYVVHVNLILLVFLYIDMSIYLYMYMYMYAEHYMCTCTCLCTYVLVNANRVCKFTKYIHLCKGACTYVKCMYM